MVAIGINAVGVGIVRRRSGNGTSVGVKQTKAGGIFCAGCPKLPTVGILGFPSEESLLKQGESHRKHEVGGVE